MNFSVQECPDGQHNRFCAELEPHLGYGTHDAIVLDDKIFNCLLEDHQVRLVLQRGAHSLTVKHAVCLCTGGANSRTFTRV